MYQHKQDLLDVQQAADRLSVSEKWIHRRIGEGDLPFDYFKVGKHLRFRPDDLDAYLASCRREAVAS